MTAITLIKLLKNIKNVMKRAIDVIMEEMHHISNCYESCSFYYYFNETNIFNCVESCPEKYNKLILSQNRCIDKCENDNIYKYEYNNNCYQSCPDGTYVNESIYICYNYENNKINIESTIFINKNEIIKENIQQFKNEFITDFNISENKKIIQIKIYQQLI